MGISIGGQAAAFAGAVALGLAVGLVYDILRILRVRLKNRLLSGILDLIFWIIVIAAVFLYALSAGDGQVRIFMALGLMGGGMLYFCLLSPPMLWLGYRIADFISLLFRILALPFIWFFKLCNKIEKKLKNIFYYLSGWYRISALPGEMTRRQGDTGRSGGGKRENQESRAANKNYRDSTAGLHGNISAQSPRADQVGAGAKRGRRRAGRRTVKEKQ
ncbi:MAG: spore cortex biosynthesis protein YabQ [Oscillospiraceae bacterium]|nr:spore cortex biosynthesis protein YabQ [Oscillospiraceae bacterium]